MKRGFTLIELLVYIAIMSFIIVVAGRAYSDATGMRVRTQSMTKATEEVNRIAEIIKEDLSQMGAKAWINSDNQGNYAAQPTEQRAYIDIVSGDSSSFELWHRTQLPKGNDSIQFRKISYDPDGKYIGTRLISWALSSDRILRRRCVTLHSSTSLSDPEIGSCPHANDVNASSVVPVIMAEDVQAFVFYPSKPLEDPIGKGADKSSWGGELTAGSPNPTFSLISRATSGNYYATGITQPASGTNTAILNGSSPCDVGRLCFEKNNPSTNQMKQHQVFVAGPGASGGNIGNCESFSFKKNETYAIKFKTPMNYMKAGNELVPDSMMSLFQPGVDHMAVGFRSSNGDPISLMPTDFMFYPPQKNVEDDISKTNQYFEFSVPNDVSNACVAFTFAFYSGPVNGDFGPHKGKLRIKDFELLHKKDGTYKFERTNPDYATSTDSDPTYEHKKNVKAFELILEVSKRNEVGSTRRQAENEYIGYVIPVPNNGIVPPEP